MNSIDIILGVFFYYFNLFSLKLRLKSRKVHKCVSSPAENASFLVLSSLPRVTSHLKMSQKCMLTHFQKASCYCLCGEVKTFFKLTGIWNRLICFLIYSR